MEGLENFEQVENELKKLVSNFSFVGKLTETSINKIGNINDTYVLEFCDDNNMRNKYILQRVNCDVFKNPENLMENIARVTQHIKGKIEEASGDVNRGTLNLISTVDGGTHFFCENGHCWRAFKFIEGARTYMVATEPKHMYETGKALGKFQKYLTDFKADTLHETIPDFHNTAKRFETFEKVVKEDIAGRVKYALAEIDFILTRGEDTKKVVNLINEGLIPIRVTHNDTKFNNIMIDDNSGEGIAVIDLDTVMPGSYLYDFGDAVRSGAATAEEDETDLDKVGIDLALYEVFKKGYLEEVGDILTDKEKELLPFSVKLITLELAMRFLTDYLEGDIYFKTISENHNLERAKNQIKLCAQIEEHIN